MPERREAKVRLRIKKIDLEVRVTGTKGPKHCQNIFIIAAFVVEKNRPYVRRLREGMPSFRNPQNQNCVWFVEFLFSQFLCLLSASLVCG